MTTTKKQAGCVSSTEGLSNIKAAGRVSLDLHGGGAGAGHSLKELVLAEQIERAEGAGMGAGAVPEFIGGAGVRGYRGDNSRDDAAAAAAADELFAARSPRCAEIVAECRAEEADWSAVQAQARAAAVKQAWLVRERRGVTPSSSSIRDAADMAASAIVAARDAGAGPVSRALLVADGRADSFEDGPGELAAAAGDVGILANRWAARAAWSSLVHWASGGTGADGDGSRADIVGGDDGAALLARVPDGAARARGVVDWMESRAARRAMAGQLYRLCLSPYPPDGDGLWVKESQALIDFVRNELRSERESLGYAMVRRSDVGVLRRAAQISRKGAARAAARRRGRVLAAVVLGDSLEIAAGRAFKSVSAFIESCQTAGTGASLRAFLVTRAAERSEEFAVGARAAGLAAGAAWRVICAGAGAAAVPQTDTVRAGTVRGRAAAAAAVAKRAAVRDYLRAAAAREWHVARRRAAIASAAAGADTLWQGLQRRAWRRLSAVAGMSSETGARRGAGKPDGSMIRRARGSFADKSARAARAADAAAVAAVMLPKRKRAQQGAKLAPVVV